MVSLEPIYDDLKARYDERMALALEDIAARFAAKSTKKATAPRKRAAKKAAPQRA